MAKILGHEVTESQISHRLQGTHCYAAGCCGLADFEGTYSINTVQDVLAIRVAATRKPLRKGQLAISGIASVGYKCGYVILSTARPASIKDQPTSLEGLLLEGGFKVLAEFFNPAHPSIGGASLIKVWGAPTIDIPEEVKVEVKPLLQGAPDAKVEAPAPAYNGMFWGKIEI